MNCDAIAPVYRFCEYAVFGQRLQRHRTRFLEAARHRRRALILGDGDGRFASQLHRINADLVFDSIDLSERMLAEARRRVADQSQPDSQWVCGDARELPFPRSHYDLIATHFFLDCFSTRDVEILVRKIAQHADSGALWLISEFQRPRGFWRGLHADLWLGIMYRFFRVATGLKAQSLPDYHHVLKQHGFTLLEKEASMGELVCSELWRFDMSDPVETCF
jgi:ubiquinone/menaquinone biosynthesis C-methylase UbiE